MLPAQVDQKQTAASVGLRACQLSCSGGMDTYTVELRVESEHLSPAQVSIDLGLEPSLVRRAGEPRSGTSVFSKSLWAFSGAMPVKEWDSIEDGLHDLLGALTPKRSQLEPYFQQCPVYWWCGKFQSSFDGISTLSPGTFKALAEFAGGTQSSTTARYSRSCRCPTRRTTST